MTSKKLFKTTGKIIPPESPSLSIENEDGGLKENYIKQTDNERNSSSKKWKRVTKKFKDITEKHKNDIIKTITNKIKDSYMKNNLQGSYEHR